MGNENIIDKGYLNKLDGTEEIPDGAIMAAIDSIIEKDGKETILKDEAGAIEKIKKAVAPNVVDEEKVQELEEKIKKNIQERLSEQFKEAA